mmetsp:Transcript_18919/g.59737  ORF Transcript_18919/g.59737 Transcript_18919/m.59737 type:complete len:202 (-) Transcript_18919:589-1194(-)
MRGGGSVCVCSLHGRERECFPHHRQLLLDETGSQRRNLVPVHQRPPAEALTETLTEIRTKISTKILSETETVPRAEALVEDNTVSVSVEGTAQKRTRLAARGKLRLLAVLGATALVEGAVAGGVGQVEGRGCEGGCEGAHAVETNAVRAVDPQWLARMPVTQFLKGRGQHCEVALVRQTAQVFESAHVGFSWGGVSRRLGR